MNNYVYIVAGLPDLVLNFDNPNFVYDHAKESFLTQLSEKDQKMVEFLEEGFDEDRLNADFYERALHCKDRFVHDYFLFDLIARNMKVKYLAKRLSQDASKYLIEAPDVEFEEEKKIQAILDDADFVQREQQMDLLKWEKCNEITCMEYFTLDVILAFLSKAKIVQRWSVMDTATGDSMFRKLVDEVRGTFKGVEYQQQK